MDNTIPDKVYLYNPLSTDFTVTYDINGDKSPHPFTIPAGQILSFNEPLSSHMHYHLAMAVVATKKGNLADTYKYQEALKEIEVKI